MSLIKRPWGGYTILKKTNRFWVKKLLIRQKERFSLQSHCDREEVWFVLSGTILAQIGKERRKGKSGDFFFVPKKKKHRITGITEAVVLEVAFGKTLETDITRYEDDYGRV